MIVFDKVSRRYGDLTAVDAVSLEIGAREVVGLLGHNGAGKTTLMKMLAGMLEPSAGTIRLDALEHGRDTSAIQARIGYLPENCPLWPELTVLDFLELQAALHGVAPARRGAAVAAAVRRTALKDKAEAPIHTLSRGYRQRGGGAQAILHEPEVVVLDEPTNGLDPTQVQQMRALVAELARSATVIVSTHVLQEVQAVCERVVILQRGRKVVDSRLDELQRGARLQVDVDLDERAATALFATVAGAGEVRALGRAPAGGFRYAIATLAGIDAAALAPAVARAVVGAGAALLELQPERRDLETVFAEVAGGAPAAAAASQALAAETADVA